MDRLTSDGLIVLETGKLWGAAPPELRKALEAAGPEKRDEALAWYICNLESRPKDELVRECAWLARSG